MQCHSSSSVSLIPIVLLFSFSFYLSRRLHLTGFCCHADDEKICFINWLFALYQWREVSPCSLRGAVYNYQTFLHFIPFFLLFIFRLFFLMVTSCGLLWGLAFSNVLWDKSVFILGAFRHWRIYHYDRHFEWLPFSFRFQ